MSELTSIVVQCRTYSEFACTHLHTYGQLILPLEGTLLIETPACQFELDTAHLFFLPPGCLHTFYARYRNKFLVLDIPGPLLPRQGSDAIPEGQAATLDERWQALRFLLLAEAGQTGGDNPALTHLFQYAYHQLLGLNFQPRSLQYIHKHFQEALDLPTLAVLEGFNPTYYSEWFRKETGLTLTAYLQKLRLDEAKKLLHHTDLSLAQIAQQVGYQHHASLTRLFQQHEQITPSTYRRQSRKAAKKR
jgi:AraC-like DNA-binding protein